MRRAILLGVSVLLSVGLGAGPASAAPPIHESFDDVWSDVDTEICGFEILIEGRATGRRTLSFYPDSGLLRRVNIHGNEQLTFSANGQTLQGYPFPYNFHIFFGPEGGAPERYILSGLVFRTPLPDGTTFLSAGRLDFVTFDGGSYALTPQVGRSGDVDALCAALSPQ